MSKAGSIGDKAGHAAERKQAADDQKAFRNNEWRSRSLAGESAAAIAATDGVSVATVRRGLKDATAASLDQAEAASKSAKAEKAAAAKAERDARNAVEGVEDVVKKAHEAKGSTVRQRTDLDRDGALAFQGEWTDEDREFLAAEFDRIGAEKFGKPASGSYVRIEGADGKVIAYLNPSSLDVAPGLAPEGTTAKADGWTVLPLSTHRSRRQAVSA